MLEFGGTSYYFDLDALDKAITIKHGEKGDIYTEKETKKTNATYDNGLPNLSGTNTSIVVEEFQRQVPQSKEIDATKYDMLKFFIEVIVDYEGMDDDTLGADHALDKASLGYKIVFNTLLKQEIIKEN